MILHKGVRNQRDLMEFQKEWNGFINRIEGNIRIQWKIK